MCYLTSAIGLQLEHLKTPTNVGAAAPTSRDIETWGASVERILDGVRILAHSQIGLVGGGQSVRKTECGKSNGRGGPGDGDVSLICCVIGLPLANVLACGADQQHHIWLGPGDGCRQQVPAADDDCGRA